MKTIKIAVFLVLAVSLLAITPQVYAAEGRRDNPNYFVLKGGVYSPSENYDISNFNSGNTSRIDTKTGFNGEIAVGGYLLPVLAVELGVGYFESEGSAAAEPGTTKLKAIPVLVTAKGIIPIGAMELYGEFGIGAYITKLDVDGNFGSFSGQSKTTYGVHAGAGFNIDVSDTTFIGMEGRYLRAKPDYGGQPVKLNGFTATVDLGFRY